MIYLHSLRLPGAEAETDFFYRITRTCYNNFYPFQIFPEMGLRELTFEPVTILCSGNGSGKTTLLNIIAEQIGAERSAPYNQSSFFADYLSLCQIETESDSSKALKNAAIITSDDVFEYLLQIRALNEGIDLKREELISEYTDMKYAKFQMRSMEDYEQLRKVAAARRSTGSGYVKSRLMKLNHEHIQYVLDCFRENTTRVRNIKQYLLASLYNAPMTIDSYYRARVQHDLYGKE